MAAIPYATRPWLCPRCFLAHPIKEAMQTHLRTDHLDAHPVADAAQQHQHPAPRRIRRGRAGGTEEQA